MAGVPVHQVRARCPSACYHHASNGYADRRWYAIPLISHVGRHPAGPGRKCHRGAEVFSAPPPRRRTLAWLFREDSSRIAHPCLLCLKKFLDPMFQRIPYDKHWSRHAARPSWHRPPRGPGAFALAVRPDQRVAQSSDYYGRRPVGGTGDHMVVLRASPAAAGRCRPLDATSCRRFARCGPRARDRSYGDWRVVTAAGPGRRIQRYASPTDTSRALTRRGVRCRHSGLSSTLRQRAFRAAWSLSDLRITSRWLPAEPESSKNWNDRLADYSCA